MYPLGDEEVCFHFIFSAGKKKKKKKVVRTALEEEIKEGDKEEYRKLFKGAEQKKKFREAVEETIKANLYRNPSVIEV